jgi:hypothetical protein
VLSGAGPVDAVTTQAFEYRAAFHSWGMDGDIHAAFVEPAVRAQVQPLAELRADPGDLLLFHYSAYAPRLEPLLDWPQRKLLVYHNVTPAEWLWEHQPHVATLCALGRDHLPRWARAADVAAAVSDFNAAARRGSGRARSPSTQARSRSGSWTTAHLEQGSFRSGDWLRTSGRT